MKFHRLRRAKQKLLPKVLGSVKSTGRTVVQRKLLHNIPHAQVCLRGLLPFCPGWPKPRPSAYTQDLDWDPTLPVSVFQLLAPAEILGWDLHCQRYLRLAARAAFPGAMVLRPSRMLWGSWAQKPFYVHFLIAVQGSIQHPRSSLSSKGTKWLLIREGRGAETEEEQSRANSSGTSLVVQWAHYKGCRFYPWWKWRSHTSERSNNMK